MRNSEVFNRLQNLIGYLPLQKEISAKTGINQNTLSAKKVRNSQWKDEELQKLNKAFNVDIYKNENKQLKMIKDCVFGNFYPDIFASCGNGCYVLSGNKEPINIPKKFFVKPFSEFKTYSVIVARGNSMEPAIYDKDRLIIEHVEAGEQIKDGSIYVFCYDNSIYTKRLYKNIDEIIVKSDNENPIYQLKSIKKDDMNNVILIGEVVGLMRDLR